MSLKTETNLMKIVEKLIKEYDSNSVTDTIYNESVERQVLIWLKYINERVSGIHSLRKIIQESINELIYQLTVTKDILDNTRIQYNIDILKTCLFIIDLDIKNYQETQMCR